MTAYYTRVSRLDPPRRLPARGRGDRPLRGSAPADRRLAGLDPGGDDLRRQRDRRDQPGRLHLGASERQSRRPRGADRDGAPLQHRSLAAALPGPRGGARLRAGARRRPARSRCAGRVACARAQARQPGPRLKRARHDQPGRGDHTPRSCRRRRGADRRDPGGPAAAGRPARDRRGLLRLDRPQGLRADRDRSAARAACAARGDASVHRRRPHDPHGRGERVDLDRPAVEVRGRNLADRRGDRARGRRRLAERNRAGARSRARAGADGRGARAAELGGPGASRARSACRGRPRRTRLVHARGCPSPRHR